jgi:uncharacterized protein (DUF433 family)
MARHERIAVTKDVMMGKPVVRGTSVSVELLLRQLAAGATEAELIAEHPDLAHADILAALEFGADAVAHWELEIEES